MTFLPIVERELRVSARKRSTFWLRVVFAIVGLVKGALDAVKLAVDVWKKLREPVKESSTSKVIVLFASPGRGEVIQINAQMSQEDVERSVGDLLGAPRTASPP